LIEPVPVTLKSCFEPTTVAPDTPANAIGKATTATAINNLLIIFSPPGIMRGSGIYDTSPFEEECKIGAVNAQ
jgi:hypothetical protein